MARRAICCPASKAIVATFDWQDANTLAYVADIGTESEVGVISVDGADRRTLLPPGTLWSRASMSAGGEQWRSSRRRRDTPMSCIR